MASTLDLRAPGRVLLLSCYELGHQPSGLAIPAAFFERQGFAPAAIDLSAERLVEGPAERARLVLIAVPMHTALRLGINAADHVRRVNPGATIVMHGLYALLNADHLLAHGVDAVRGGECEQDLIDIAIALDAEQPISPRVDRGRALTRVAFPRPARGGLLPLTRYAKLAIAGEERLVGHTEASRGCLHLCAHCPLPPVYGGRFFVVPRDVVAADIAQLVAAGAQHITFGDPDFLNGPGHAWAVIDALHRAHPDVTFDITAKVEHLLRHRARLSELAARGCLFVISAVESLSDRALACLDKGHTAAEVREVVAVARAAGLTLRPTFVPFTPWTTLGDYRAMLDFIADEGLVHHVDAVQYSIRLLVPPGSLLLARGDLAPHLTDVAPADFAHRWRHPDPAMDELQRAVAAAVEQAGAAGADALTTFEQVRRLAHGHAPPSDRDLADRCGDAHAVPRLTEAWFC